MLSSNIYLFFFLLTFTLALISIRYAHCNFCLYFTWAFYDYIFNPVTSPVNIHSFIAGLNMSGNKKNYDPAFTAWSTLHSFIGRCIFLGRCTFLVFSRMYKIIFHFFHSRKSKHSFCLGEKNVLHIHMCFLSFISSLVQHLHTYIYI